MNLCIAGKNNIAVLALQYLLENFPEHTYYGCCNATDDGINGFQRSYKSYCQLSNIRVLPLSDLEKMQDLIFFSLEFDRIIKPSNFSTKRLYNIHFSLLPAYKGMYTSAMPLINNEKFAGVTFHEIDSGIDTGHIIDQIRFDLPPSFTSEDLYHAYIENSFVLFKRNIDNVLANNLKSEQQSVQNSSYYSKSAIDYSNLQVDLNKTCAEIFNQVRAFSFPFYQMPTILGHSVYFSEPTAIRSIGKAGKMVAEDDFMLEITTIDYNIRLLKDKRLELFKACEAGEVEVVQYFVNNSYPINQRSRAGWDCLIIAAYHNQFDLVKYLIEDLSWDVNTCNNNGTTFLMYLMTACSKLNETESLLYALELEHIDVYKKDFFGFDVFHYAKKYNCKRVVEIINNFKYND